MTVRLKEGDFFGEMGLLGSRPRNADVVAVGYCHLLVLYRRDFNALLAGRPEVRSEIEAVAARRGAETPVEATAAN
jgi:monovalent cation:H+ antiporter, CPA1 family